MVYEGENEILKLNRNFVSYRYSSHNQLRSVGPTMEPIEDVGSISYRFQ